LLAGGGYAQFVAVPAGQVMPVPDTVELHHAAALPEVACTVWSNLVMTAGLAAGQVVLLHGGASGIGTHAIQIARALDCRVAVTAGSKRKLDLCKELGAEILINYREADFVEQLRAATGGAGADVILDIMGATYLDRNIDALADDGRVVVIGMQGGVKGELNLGKLLGKRGGVIATALRGRPVEGPASKSAVVTEVVRNVWPMVADGRVRPVIGAEFPIDQARAAHELLNSGDVFGKVLLRGTG
jgi:putative PIG3 family NAD(P)H quinone oxidoreductase